MVIFAKSGSEESKCCQKVSGEVCGLNSVSSVISSETLFILSFLLDYLMK
jgi:hypothetical protein